MQGVSLFQEYDYAQLLSSFLESVVGVTFSLLPDVVPPTTMLIFKAAEGCNDHIVDGYPIPMYSSTPQSGCSLPHKATLVFPFDTDYLSFSQTKQKIWHILIVLWDNLTYFPCFYCVKFSFTFFDQ